MEKLKTIEQSRVREGSPMGGVRIYGWKDFWKMVTLVSFVFLLLIVLLPP